MSTGVSFNGLPDGKRYSVSVDLPRFGINGKLDINTVVPSHYPCSLHAKEGETLEMMSNIGWTDLVPDANASAAFTYNDRSVNQKVNFINGIGYHDHK